MGKTFTTVCINNSDLQILKENIMPAIIAKFPYLEAEKLTYSKALHLLFMAWKGEIKL